MKKRLQILGIGFCIAGVVFTPVSYFVLGSIPLTAVGISAIMIGTTCVLLACTCPSLSREMYQLVLKTGMENTAALLEGLGLSNKAIYMPSTMRDNDRQVLIPLEGDVNINSVKEILPDKVIVRYGQNDDMAVSLITPGSIDPDWFEMMPGPTVDEIDSAINYILTEVLDIADSASVILLDDKVYVAVSNPKQVFSNTWYFQCIGSPVASIIASITCEALGRPIRIIDENPENQLSTITLEVLH